MDSQMENANTIRYITGRSYECAQVLEITITGRSTDEFGLETIQATFTDASRHISGKCEALVFNDGIGAAVLCAYDAGRYTSI